MELLEQILSNQITIMNVLDILLFNIAGRGYLEDELDTRIQETEAILEPKRINTNKIKSNLEEVFA